MEEGAMAKELLPDPFWARIAPLLPPEPPKPKGGRPRVSDRAALTGILFVLKTGIPWEYLPAEMGVWERDDVLAQAARLVPSGRLAQAAPGASRRASPSRSHRLGPGRAGLRERGKEHQMWSVVIPASNRYADFDIMKTILPFSRSGSCLLANAALRADTISALE